MAEQPSGIGAVIVNYHTGHLLPDLLAVLAAEPSVTEILIIDNSAGDPALGSIPRAPFLRVVNPGANLGFAAAVNRAARELSSPWWLIINPDVRLKIGTVGTLLSAANARQALIVGPRAFWDDEYSWRLPPASGDSLWLRAGAKNAGNALDAHLMAFCAMMRHERYWARAEPFFEPFLSGACLLVRNDPVWFPGRRIFDERYFVYYEDTDLCARLLAEHQNLLCVPDAAIVHYWDQAPRTEKAEYIQSAAERYFCKHYGISPPSAEPTDSILTPLDLGTAQTRPYLRAPIGAHRDALKLEVAVAPDFRVFAQRDYDPGMPAFTEAHWQRLAPRRYYARLRRPDSPHVAYAWCWEKT